MYQVRIWWRCGGIKEDMKRFGLFWQDAEVENKYRKIENWKHWDSAYLRQGMSVMALSQAGDVMTS